MSGICGIFNFEKQNSADRRTVEKMTQSLKHRGPDGSKVYMNKNIGIGIRQLNTSSNKLKVQLVHNEDDTIWAVLDGEIYNNKELYKLLESKNHAIHTKDGFELAVHLYEEFGNNFVSHLNGMFAFVLVDIKQQKILIGRDRMGEKPLYYNINKSGIVFGSEIKAILQHGCINKEIDYESLNNFLTFNYVPSPSSILKGVSKLLPAHILTWHKGDVEISPYWDYIFEEGSAKNEKYYTNSILEIFRESVRKRLNIQDPPGAFLSGGIDSSAVVGMMTQLMDRPPKTFAVGFEEAHYSELTYARIVAEHFKTEHHEIIIKPEMVKEFLCRAIWHYDEPFADSSAIPTYFGCKYAKEHVKVVLTGDGPDQMLAGSKNYLAEEQRKYIPIPEIIKKLILTRIVNNFPISPVNSTVGEKIKRKLKMETMTSSQRHIIRRTYGFFDDGKRKLYKNDYKSIMSTNSAMKIGEKYYNICTAKKLLNKMLYIDTKMFIPDDLMVKVDRSAMAVGLETRKAFLDHNFVEFSGTIPTEMKLKGLGVLKEAKIKYILKKGLSKLLPGQTLKNKKHGFEAPISRWFKNELKDYVAEIIFDNKTKVRGYFDYNYIEEIWEQHQTGSCDNSLRIWALLIFELWQREFID